MWPLFSRSNYEKRRGGKEGTNGDEGCATRKAELKLTPAIVEKKVRAKTGCSRRVGGRNATLTRARYTSLVSSSWGKRNKAKKNAKRRKPMPFWREGQSCDMSEER